MWTRREMLRNAAVGAMAVTFAGTFEKMAAQASEKSGPLEKRPYRIGACDWDLAGVNAPNSLDVAKEMGLDGAQISFMFMEKDARCDLRKPENQALYLRKSEETGVAISSYALGDGNANPFWALEDAEKRIRDCMNCMVAMGGVGKCVLIPFFGSATIDSDEKFAVTIQRLKNVAPQAQDLGVVLAVESTLTAEGHLRILNGVNSPAVQVYYDPGNMHNFQKMDTAAICEDIRKLRGLIAETHAKDNGLLGQGALDYAQILATFREVGYSGWQTMESSRDHTLGPIESYRRNAAYLRKI